MPERDPGFGIYVHWPFCAAKCPYCDFNSHVRGGVDHDLWRDALIWDLRSQSAKSDRAVVTSIFFGGGTPSLMEPKTVDALIDEVARLWPVADDLEVTLEANPTSVEAGKFQEFRSAGVNRISMGIQALNDADLKALGRMHSAKEAMAAFDVARDAFARVSFDLIYARQRQSLDQWEAELTQALGMAVDHLSLYQLTIEAGTRFGDLWKRGRLRDLPSDGLASDMYDLTQTICNEHGMSAYEISNHARPGAECRHNLTYWRYGGYLGVGPGAHGRVLRNGQRIETSAELIPENWLALVESNGNGLTQDNGLAPSDQAVEYLLMGLRLVEGISLERYSDLGGDPFDQTVVSELEELGLIEQVDGNLAATSDGRRVLNTIIEKLAP